MPKITPALPYAHPRHPHPDDQLAAGWCLACYADGAFTLAVGPDAARCALHGVLTAPTPATPQPCRTPRRAPRGRAARTPSPPPGPPVRTRTPRRVAARRVARAMAYGRRRAAARVAAPGYAPHPGWRHFIAEGWRVLTDQREALAAIDRLVDTQEWRADKRAAWTAILHRLVHAMDWTTGLIAALTAQRLGAAGGRAPRTVSRVIAWARDIGLLVVVEQAASAEFLGTDHGRTPTYALVTTDPPHRPAAPDSPPDDCIERSPDHCVDHPVDELGDPSASCVNQNKPLNQRLEPAGYLPASWPVFGIPRSPVERTAATRCLFQRLGLDHRGVSGVVFWRARALLRPWWDARASPAGLLWAIDHHPDRPDHHRGDALRGARDPLRVLGARLRPWQQRLGELPRAVAGVPGDYRPADPQASAQAAVHEHLRQLRTRISRPGPTTSATPPKHLL